MSDRPQSNMRQLKTQVVAFTGLLVMAGTFSGSVSAACKNIGCACKPSELQFASPSMQPNEDGQYAISLEADDVEAQGQDLVTLTGNAEVAQGRQTIVADQLKYYRNTERVVATGNVEMISKNGDYLSSDSIDVHAPTQIGSLSNARFKLSKGLSRADGVDTVKIDSRGSAAKLNLEGEGLIRLEDAEYTTCPEGDRSVIISAKELELDRAGGVGRARGAMIRFKGIPLFYTPYISFPINDERKTGLLTPSFGSDEDSGNIFAFPWYWNIAKNQDATITPRYYSERGFQLAAEYRLKTSKSDTYIYAESLSGDDLVEEFNTTLGIEDQLETDRSMFTLQHSQQFTNNLSGRINFNDVSDVDYFTDLRNDDVRFFSATFVPRDVQLSYSHKYFKLGARANEYQIIDSEISESSKPYERLPSFSFASNLPTGPMGIKYGINASHTDFDAEARVNGTRTTFDPYVSKSFRSIWGYVKPSLSVHHRTYSLQDRSAELPTDPSFTVPLFSVDAGIYFEKNTSWFGESALQTLEPRLFYAYASNDEDQDLAPIFDTSQVSLNNFSNIFRANRFYGGDRVGDANQVTLGLTSRIIDNESGDQRLKASFGQLYIIEDLEQNIRSTSAIPSGLGDFLAEVKTNSKGAWSTYGFVQYDHEESEIRTARFNVGYEPKDNSRKRVRLGYYYSKGFTQANGSSNDTEQLTLRVNWPVTDRIQFFGTERYSLEDKESRYADFGLEYDSCCWKVRLMGQNRINNSSTSSDNDDKKTAIMLELELTSLGGISTGL